MSFLLFVNVFKLFVFVTCFWLGITLHCLQCKICIFPWVKHPALANSTLFDIFHYAFSFAVMETSSSGYRFRRIPHHSFAGSLNLDPLVSLVFKLLDLLILLCLDRFYRDWEEMILSLNCYLSFSSSLFHCQ